VRRVGLLPLPLVAGFVATGWLYLFEPRVPGPRVGEALPLDELSKHAAAPLLWFTVVWGALGVLLALYARWARIERLTAVLLLALAVGLFVYLETALSVAVVRQVSLHDALDLAARMKAVYLPALIVAIAIGLLADRRTGRNGAAIVGWVVAAGAALDLLHAVVPGDDEGLLRSLTPDAVGPLAHAAGILTAIGLLASARGLMRRRRRAWQVATALAAFSTLMHVLHGLNDGTLASAFVLVLLVARRGDFDGPGDVTTRGRLAVRLVACAAAVVGYGFAALWINRLDADQPFGPKFAFSEIGRGLLGLDVRGSTHLSGAFGDWFPLSLLLLGAAGVAWCVAGWIAPWRHRVEQVEHQRELASALVRAWGADTLAPFVLRSDKSYFFLEDESAVLAYRVVGGVAIVSGDPIGPPESADLLIGAFIDLARARDWRIAILGASEQCLPVYAAHGLQAVYHGDEAIVDPRGFSLEGRPIRKVRQSVHRLDGSGYRAAVLWPSELDDRLRDELESVARSWRGDAPERGFVMALDALFGLSDEHAVFVVGFGPDGRAAGFLHFALSPAGHALSLSSMPRLRDTPNGFNEWLICQALFWARERGYERVSLNFSPFAALLGTDAELNTVQELQRRALLRLKGHFQLDNLLAFNRKFFPDWERRFVVFERRRDLPRVGIAALAAEAYLPFQAERR
jgi:lysyl-tRNA synthetase class 2